MHLNDVNAIRRMVHEAAAGGGTRVLVLPHVDEHEMVVEAEVLKTEQPEMYGSVRVFATGPHQVSFEREQAAADAG